MEMIAISKVFDGFFKPTHTNKENTPFKLTNAQLLALLPHRHAKAAALRWGPVRE
jgi:hypothetical protein